MNQPASQQSNKNMTGPTAHDLVREVLRDGLGMTRSESQNLLRNLDH